MTRLGMRLAVTEPLPMQAQSPPAARMGVERVRTVAEALPVYDGPYAVTPSGDAQTLETTGMKLTGDIAVAPVPADYPFDLAPVVLRPDAELVERYTYDKRLIAGEGIALPAYSTTAKTLKASVNLTPTVALDYDNYHYYIVERMLAAPEYFAATKAKGREEYFADSHVFEVVEIPANSFVAADGKAITTRTVVVCGQSMPRMLYWSSATAVALYTATTYGIAMGATAPTIASGVLTLKSPTFLIRGSTTYLTSAMWALIEDIRFQYVIEVYRASKGGRNVDGWATSQSFEHINACWADVAAGRTLT